MPRRLLLIALLGAAITGCRTTPGPEATAEAYAAALREGRLDDAYALTAEAPKGARLSREEFERRYASEEARRARAAEVASGALTVTASNEVVTLVKAPEQWRIVEPDVVNAAREALRSFVAAVEAGDFEQVYALLGGSLRARYTPGRLKADFEAEPQAKERVARAKAALEKEPILEAGRARFPLGEGRFVQLALEEGAYRVVALE